MKLLVSLLALFSILSLVASETCRTGRTGKKGDLCGTTTLCCDPYHCGRLGGGGGVFAHHCICPAKGEKCHGDGKGPTACCEGLVCLENKLCDYPDKGPQSKCCPLRKGEGTLLAPTTLDFEKSRITCKYALNSKHLDCYYDISKGDSEAGSPSACPAKHTCPTGNFEGSYWNKCCPQANGWKLNAILSNKNRLHCEYVRYNKETCEYDSNKGTVIPNKDSPTCPSQLITAYDCPYDGR